MANSNLSKEEYNEIPVLYCKHCLSLRIRDAGLKELLYCDKCSSTDIGETSIEEWEDLHKSKYGFRFLDK